MFVSMQIYEFLSKSQLEREDRNKEEDVCLYANIRIFKQITTKMISYGMVWLMFVSMQIYEFLSKSQRSAEVMANLNDVCLYANIRIFKQITTTFNFLLTFAKMFVSMQIYEFLSKSQQVVNLFIRLSRCLSLCKYTNF